MDADFVLRVIAYFALLSLSGFFSGSETALFSISPVQLLRLREAGQPRALLLEELLNRPRRLIATIFIGNELVNIGASALMTGVTNRYLGGRGDVLVAVVSTGISVVLILFIGEIVPKNLAAKVVERWALVAARPIALLAVIMAPLRWMIERIADGVVQVVGGPPRESAAVAVGEGEFRTMVDLVSADGQLDRREMELIHKVFEFGDRRVAEVMTPAERVFALSDNLPMQTVIDEVRRHRFSRIPVFSGARERIVGVLFAKDLIPLLRGASDPPAHGTARTGTVADGRLEIRRWLHPPYFVPRATKCEQLLREFRRRRIHMALVVDEYGRLSGLVTMEDLLEEMFGEIRDEKEAAPPPAQVGGEGR